MFAGLGVIAWIASGAIPRAARPGCVAVIASAVPAMLGFVFFPEADSLGDLRPFFIVAIALWIALYFAPRTRGRALFVGLALVLFWVWIAGEVIGPDDAASLPLQPESSVTFDSPPLCEVTPDTLPSEFGECDSFSQYDVTSGDVAGPPIAPFFFSPFSISSASDKRLEIGIVSTMIAIADLGAMALLDRARLRGLATAFVVAGVLALETGIAALASWTDRLWAAGLLTLAAGVALGLAGQLGGRRLTTWLGGAVAALGTVLVAFDVTRIDSSFGGTASPKLVGPGLTVMAFGAVLMAFAWFVARTTRGEPDAPTPPAAATEPPL
jgi:hypothetical protein